MAAPCATVLLAALAGDCDWVVKAGNASEAMTAAAGYRPVGKDFLFSRTRTPRHAHRAQHGHGYHGFRVYAAPDVTFEDDSTVVT